MQRNYTSYLLIHQIRDEHNQSTGKAILLHVGEMIPKLKTRQSGAGSAGSTQPQTSGGGGAGKKKKGKKK